MMMDKQELAKLLERYRQGTCTDAERSLVERLYLHTYESNPVPENADAKKRVWQHISEKSQPTRTYRFIKRIAVAASVLLLATIAWWYAQVAENQSEIAQVMDIPAGGNKAVLKLADGQTLSLDTSQVGIVMRDGSLVYADSSLLANTHDFSDESKFNEIITPRGGIYQIVLEDGTKVWMNADSKLRFPARFAGSTREVELEGEAYFDVTENPKRPFVIKTAAQEIQVLGTSFNVNAYPGGNAEQTTLVAGRVMVATPQQTVSLSPGEQAVVSGGGVAVGEVDTSPFVAWKSGYFAFNEETLGQIMQNISRWYDVDVDFEGVDLSQRFGGMVSRYANVSEVLKRLELTGQVAFKIEERRIVVKQ